jgi:predicted phage terminase large subunit-like protein
MPNLTKRAARADGLPAPLRWALEFLSDHFTDAPCRLHVELMEVLADPGKRLVARVAPRGHAKSTCATLAYPLWCLCERKRRNIVIVTHESSLARQFVRDIRTELECNERILSAYGDLCAEGGRDRPAIQQASEPRRPKGTAQRRTRKPKRNWSTTLFTTATDITVQAKGAGAGLRGLRVGAHRPDLIICDDLEKDEHVESPEQRRKLEDWLRRVVMPALAPDGQLLVLGSIIHYDSLLANLRDRTRWPHWDYAVYRAIEAEPGPDGEYRLVPLWPARWPLERLNLERERIGTRAFEQEYQANPVDDSLRVFRPEWLRRYDPGELVPERLVSLMAVDPATGQSDGDYFALWVGSLDTATGVIYTRRLSLERIGVVDQIKRIVAAFEEWRPVKVGIETVAYQAALAQILEEESRRRGLYMPIVPLQTTANKRARIEGSAPFFENGMFRLPPVLDPEVERQFLHFPKARHDDAPDVCAMGIELARSLRSTRIEVASAQRSPRADPGAW